ncbi:MAG: DUF3619 family protein [Methylotenera sp.]|nr:DUF3619 family protein [Methylotenera sp.]NOT66509.1 DUF3619 family protein [Methylotenera sp.]
MTYENKINNIETDEKIVQVAADLLKDNSEHLNAVTLQRLSTARNLAVNQLAARQTQTAQGVNHSGNVLLWLGHGFGSYFGHHRMMSTAMLAGVVMLSFFAAQQFGFDNNLESGDAFLLASELPPEAFADKGFDTWVVSKRD